MNYRTKSAIRRALAIGMLALVIVLFALAPVMGHAEPAAPEQIVVTPMINLTGAINAILALLAAVITYKVIPWIKAKTTNEQQMFIEATVRTLVFAAEQIYGAGHGREKMEYVVEKLEEKGYTVDTDDIEAAVYNYLSGDKPDAKPDTEG